MKIFGLFLLVCFAVCAADVDAQSKRRRKSAAKPLKVAQVKTAKTIYKTISAGVVNGRAIDLVKPEYPKSARTINVYGQVSVQVLIDENGDVISAKDISGHPLLRSASVKAARQSKFKPVTLSGEPVRVSGVIYYIFTLSEWNWLEVGYTLNFGSGYYSIETLLKTFPSGFKEEQQLLRQRFESAENENIQIVVASIRNKLRDDEKAVWLFSVGAALAKVEIESNANVDFSNTDFQSFENLKMLAQNPPDGVKTGLMTNLKKFTALREEHKTSESFQILRQMKENFPFLRR